LVVATFLHPAVACVQRAYTTVVEAEAHRVRVAAALANPLRAPAAAGGRFPGTDPERPVPMRTSTVLVVLLSVLGCATEPAGDGQAEPEALSACPGSNVVVDPPELQWTFHDGPEPHHSAVLEYGEATFDIGGETLTTRAYRQAGGAYSIPGPTMTMVPGNTYVVRFRNRLPYQPASGAENVLKDPNVTNLHTHGLHISPLSPSDDVARFFEGTRGGDFVYDIPADHMGGTYWYHAHHHGSTFLQVSSGALGMIVIDDGGDGIPPAVEAMAVRQLVVAYLDPSVAGAGGDTLIAGTLDPTWTVNGLAGGSLCSPAGEWQRWRVLLADSRAVDRTLSVGAGCEVALLARDGVWRTSAPKALPTRSLDVTGASRADLAVRCTTDSSISVEGTPVASIMVGGAGNTAVGPYSGGSTGGTWSASRPSYLRDLRGVSSVNTENIQMGARTINGAHFDMDVPTFTLPANQVQDWSLSGTSGHPFHLHVYHVQAQDCSGSYENGEYYDTMSDPCSVRFDLNTTTSRVYDGATMMHCHVLEHEDRGAMGWIDVQGGLAPPDFPIDEGLAAPYAESYAQGSPEWCVSDGDCGDGDVCNGVETCVGEECLADDPLDCDDGNACTIDSCDAALGCVHTPTCPITLATETFESGTWSGGKLWYDPAWTVTGDATLLTGEEPHAGAWHAKLRRGTGKIQRRFRRKTATVVHLKFWAKVSSFEEADLAEVKVSTAGGTLVTVKTFTAADSDDQYHYYDLDISSLAVTPQVRVVFDANMNAAGDSWYIDAIRVDGLR
jgi:FtsP/CotA-like multicopper oxidase with cupredoxin domain